MVMINININDMNLDLIKYVLRLSIVPMLFVSLLLITYGADSDINIVNIFGYILLIISGIVIFNVAKNENE